MNFCNEVCKNYLRQTGHFAAMASEEEAGVVDMGEFGEEAKYVIAFDPLDGSSNIDVNVSVGTIFPSIGVCLNLSEPMSGSFAERAQPGAGRLYFIWVQHGFGFLVGATMFMSLLWTRAWANFYSRGRK